MLKNETLFETLFNDLVRVGMPIQIYFPIWQLLHLR